LGAILFFYMNCSEWFFDISSVKTFLPSIQFVLLTLCVLLIDSDNGLINYSIASHLVISDVQTGPTPSPLCPSSPLSTESLNRSQFAFPIIEDCLEAASISWDFIEKIIYINAAHSTERNDAMTRDFLPVFRKSSEDIIRFEALLPDSNLPKVQGTAKSHIGALQLALVNGFRNVLILEDDVLWRVSSNKMNLLLLQELVERPFDVIIFGGTFVHHDEDHRARHSYAASSYFVNGEYVNTLISNFQEGLLKLNMEPNVKSYSIDVWWNRLMKQDLWYIVTPALVIQASYPVQFGYGENGV
jgi:glycosyl transferase, family 25